MAWDNSFPANASPVLTGTAGIRANWAALETTVGVDHNYMGQTRDGQHAKVSLYETTKPTAATKTGIVYTKAVSTATELYYEDAAGNEVKITSGGALANTDSVVAWAVFDGVTLAIADSYNVTSVANPSNGYYNITFTTSLASANYAVVGTSASTVTQNYFTFISRPYGATKTVDVCRIATIRVTHSASLQPSKQIMLAFIL